MTGKSLLPAIGDESALVYREDEPIGVEAAGHSALFKGDYKVTRNARPLGDLKWRLYNIKKDPGETNDLSESHPRLFAELIKDYADYTQKMGVLEMGSEYEAQVELANKIAAIIGIAIQPWLIGFIVTLVGLFVWRRRVRKKKIVVGG